MSHKFSLRPLALEAARMLARLLLVLSLTLTVYTQQTSDNGFWTCFVLARARLDKVDEYDREIKQLRAKLLDADRVAERVSYKLACERRRRSATTCECEGDTT